MNFWLRFYPFFTKADDNAMKIKDDHEDRDDD